MPPKAAFGAPRIFLECHNNVLFCNIDCITARVLSLFRSILCPHGVLGSSSEFNVLQHVLLLWQPVEIGGAPSFSQETA